MIGSRPLITVGLPIYNAERTLVEAVASIVGQTFDDWELLLLNDGSTDSSLAIANSFSDRRIVVISDGENRGISARLNQAVSMAQGKYFCRMDADDIAFPNRLEKQFAFMEKNPQIDLVASAVVVFNSVGDLCGVVAPKSIHSDICKHPWRGFCFPHPAWMGKSVWFNMHPYSSGADGAEDQLLLYSTHRGGAFAGMPEVLLGYREDRRTFYKMFSRRRAFWRAFAGYALDNGRLADFILLSIAQPAKIVSDYLNIRLRVSGLRNRLGAVDSSTETEWRRLLSAISSEVDKRRNK